MRNITRKEVRRWTELGARPGVVGEVRGHYRSNRSTELTWCYNRNSDCHLRYNNPLNQVMIVMSMVVMSMVVMSM